MKYNTRSPNKKNIRLEISDRLFYFTSRVTEEQLIPLPPVKNDVHENNT